MGIVMNWKTPKSLNTPQEVELYLKENGLSITVSQCHRVPTGKLNTTFEGTDDQIGKVWNFVKNLEKQEIIARMKKKALANQGLTSDF